MRLCLLLLLPVALQATPADLVATNRALAAWVERIDADEPFLLLDLQAAELRYVHGDAQLRRCQVLHSRVDGAAPAQYLQSRLRRYGAEPFAPITPGPFDWEQYLARAADRDSALLFDAGVTLYAHATWASRGGVQLAADDLRAIYEAVADSVYLIILPSDWRPVSNDDVGR